MRLREGSKQVAWLGGGSKQVAWLGAEASKQVAWQGPGAGRGWGGV